jgi:hypothetical protein
VGTTGLIYAAIVIAWAVYLVPMALRRSHVQSRRRSVERFSSAMRVLSRQDPRAKALAASGARVQPAERVVATDVAAVPAATDLAPLRRRQAAARSAARRRRRVLAVLLAATGAVVVVAVLGYLPRWSAAVPLALVLGFLVIARRQVRSSQRAYRRALERPPHPKRVAQALRVPAGVEAQRDEAGDVPTGQVAADDQPTRLMHLDLTGPEVQEAVPIESDEVAGLWDPVPVTLPTYVTKPAVHRQVRTVDLSAADVQSSLRGDPAGPIGTTADPATEAPARAVGE